MRRACGSRLRRNISIFCVRHCFIYPTCTGTVTSVFAYMSLNIPSGTHVGQREADEANKASAYSYQDSTAKDYSN